MRGAVKDKVKVKMTDVMSIIFGATIVSLRPVVADVGHSL